MKRKSKKMTVYIDESEKWHNQALYEALLVFLQKKNISGVSLFRGFAGYGASHILHTTTILRLSENLPIKIEVVEAPEVIDQILPEMAQMVKKGLIEVSNTEMVFLES
ncbi:MAG: DUF190 domain-containing protein [Nitrospiria bacterium]